MTSLLTLRKEATALNYTSPPATLQVGVVLEQQNERLRILKFVVVRLYRFVYQRRCHRGTSIRCFMVLLSYRYNYEWIAIIRLLKATMCCTYINNTSVYALMMRREMYVCTCRNICPYTNKTS